MFDDIQICAVLRNFKSDSRYLHFDDYWIEEVDIETKHIISNYFKDFNSFLDDYILVRWDHIGKGESSDFLRRRSIIFWHPLFLQLKLFKSGDLIMPIGFAKNEKRKYEIQIHGKDSYGLLPIENSYIFNDEDIIRFTNFSKVINPYLKFLNFGVIPYYKKPEVLKNIDTRCHLAIHILLKGSIESHNHFFIIDRLIDCTIALESLYLMDEKNKREFLCERVSILLSKNEDDRNEISEIVGKFYRIRNDIIHASLMSNEDAKYLEKKFPMYEDYLRKSILAFLDLNVSHNSKNQVIKSLKKAAIDLNYKIELQKSLVLLQQADC